MIRRNAAFCKDGHHRCEHPRRGRRLPVALRSKGEDRDGTIRPAICVGIGSAGPTGRGLGGVCDDPGFHPGLFSYPPSGRDGVAGVASFRGGARWAVREGAARKTFVGGVEIEGRDGTIRPALCVGIGSAGPTGRGRGGVWDNPGFHPGLFSDPPSGRGRRGRCAWFRGGAHWAVREGAAWQVWHRSGAARVGPA